MSKQHISKHRPKLVVDNSEPELRLVPPMIDIIPPNMETVTLTKEDWVEIISIIGEIAWICNNNDLTRRINTLEDKVLKQFKDVT
tara:strand:- start:722 stop:976 length:255 start_codon:yes stop_codon:yes gene_type:complete